MYKFVIFALISQFGFAAGGEKPLSGQPFPGYYARYQYDCDACGCSASVGSISYR
ncbi:hypothetical protein [Flavobacterium arundinis]|uniref:hypothetical protein n=1 Tax=Flavobacterium arundinis TaxID=3139143 RepID=UPI00311DD844